MDGHRLLNRQNGEPGVLHGELCAGSVHAAACQQAPDHADGLGKYGARLAVREAQAVANDKGLAPAHPQNETAAGHAVKGGAGHRQKGRVSGIGIGDPDTQFQALRDRRQVPQERERFLVKVAFGNPKGFIPCCFRGAGIRFQFGAVVYTVIEHHAESSHTSSPLKSLPVTGRCLGYG